MRLRVQLVLVALVSLGLLATSGTAEDHSFVGTKSCRKCHLKQWKSWAETAMAKSFEQLKPGVSADAKTKAGLDPEKDYTADPECLSCHTTGYGQPGGFVSVAETPDLVGVGCEMCHGAGGTYTGAEYMSFKNKSYKKAELVAVGLVDTVSAEQCTGCHNTKSPFVGDDYVFDFAARKEQGTHQKFPLRYEH
jgi:hypothetical protein